MSDLISLAVIVGFFVVAVGLLRACEHIIGPDPLTTTTSDGATSDAATRATPPGAPTDAVLAPTGATEATR